MLTAKYRPYLLFGEVETTEHGFEYTPLKEDTPEELKNAYMEYVRKQDENVKNGLLVVKL